MCTCIEKSMKPGNKPCHSHVTVPVRSSSYTYKSLYVYVMKRNWKCENPRGGQAITHIPFSCKTQNSLPGVWGWSWRNKDTAHRAWKGSASIASESFPWGASFNTIEILSVSVCVANQGGIRNVLNALLDNIEGHYTINHSWRPALNTVVLDVVSVADYLCATLLGFMGVGTAWKF